MPGVMRMHLKSRNVYLENFLFTGCSNTIKFPCVILFHPDSSGHLYIPNFIEHFLSAIVLI